MPEKARFVADTNVIVSRLLFRNSLPAQALQQAMTDLHLIVSSETLIELGVVLSRPKFERYLPLDDRLKFFHLLGRVAIRVADVEAISACRDPKDDKFLALAVSGRASLILTGDEDLLALHPFHALTSCRHANISTGNE